MCIFKISREILRWLDCYKTRGWFSGAEKSTIHSSQSMSQRETIRTGQAFWVRATLQRDNAFRERLVASVTSLQQFNEFGLLPFIPMMRVLRVFARFGMCYPFRFASNVPKLQSAYQNEVQLEQVPEFDSDPVGMAYTQNLRTDASSLVYQMEVDVYAPISQSMLLQIGLRRSSEEFITCQRLKKLPLSQSGMIAISFWSKQIWQVGGV
jgi:hypothetical protein